MFRVKTNISTGEQEIIPLTQEEIEAAEIATEAEHNRIIDNQIDTMERHAQLPRVTREYMLTMFEITAAGQGVTPEQLYQANIGYRKVKDFDNAIRTLREQRRP